MTATCTRTLWPAFLLLALAGSAAAEDISKRIPAASGGRLVIDLDLGIGLRPDQGALEIRSHDAAEVRVETETSGWGAWAVVFDLAHDDAGVRLTGRVEGATSWMFGGPRVIVRAWVPRPYALDLRTSSGPVIVEGTEGSLRVRAEDGDLEVTRASGALKLRTLRGRIEVHQVKGDVDIKGSEGAIELSELQGNVRVRTTLGSIEASGIEGTISARTAEGEIELVGVRGRADARTGKGAVTTRFTSDPSGALETAEGGIDVTFPTRGAADLDARGDQLELGAGVAFSGEEGAGEAVGALNGGGAPLWLRAPRGRIRLSRR